MATDDFDLAASVLRQEEHIDGLHRTLRTNHISRLNEGKCIPSSGIVYLDILTNLERVADHAVNIAQAVLDRAPERTAMSVTSSARSSANEA